MAIVYGSQAFDPTVLPITPLSALDTEGHVKENVSVAAIANPQAQNDLVYFGRIPSNAKISKGSTLYYDAITGVTSFSVGLFQEKSMMVPDLTKGSQTCLINALDIHLAGSSNYAALAPGDGNKYAWQIAGLADDPGGYMLVVGKVVAGPSSAAGNLQNKLSFR